MCGINGIYGFDNSANALQRVKAMNQKLSHRGPDNEGVYVDNHICLGHRRLSIIDLKQRANQPITDHTGRFTIVYNGEVYNFKEIRASLGAYNFTTETDSEVILAAYIKWGPSCLDRLNGMFAFAVWDLEKKELFLARDRLGIKPLYYSWSEKELIFSSEMRSLMAGRQDGNKLNMESVADFLRYQTVHAPATIIQGVNCLMPAHYIMLKNNKLTSQHYWKARINTLDACSYEKHCKNIREILYSAVEMRLISDVPFGAFLSGGIDSSAIVAMMSKLMPEKVNTFSVVFKDSQFDESIHSKLIANLYKTNHHEIPLGIEECVSEIPLSLSAMDHPSGDGPNTYVVSKATREAGITVALSGIGGDELFAGYKLFDRLYAVKSKKYLRSTPHILRQMLGWVIRNMIPDPSGEKISDLLNKEEINIKSAYSVIRKVLMDKTILKILNTKSLPANRVEHILDSELNGYLDDSHIYSQISIAEMNTYLQNVLLRDADQMSMAHALEVRLPFLDHRLIEYLLGISDDDKKTDTPKKLLVDSMYGLLPDQIINRPKMGFTFPWEKWMKNELKEFCALQLKSLSERSFINGQEVQLMWEQFIAGSKTVTWSGIWPIVVLEYWIEKNNVSA